MDQFSSPPMWLYLYPFTPESQENGNASAFTFINPKLHFRRELVGRKITFLGTYCVTATTSYKADVMIPLSDEKNEGLEIILFAYNHTGKARVRI